MDSASSASKRLNYAALQALREALAVAWWYKGDLERFVRACVPHTEILARLDFGLSKRQTAGDLINLMGSNPKYTPTLLDIIEELCSLDDSFPHLARLEDGRLKIAEAAAAIAALREQYGKHSGLVADQRRAIELRAEARRLADSRRATLEHLAVLKERFGAMLSMDRQRRGYELQNILRELFGVFELDPKASFSVAGEQIDGAFSFEGDDYLLEARWQEPPADPAALRDFAGKIDTKLKKTLGVFVSINSFTDAAVANHSRRGASMLLVDGEDLYAVLDNRVPLPDMLLRKRRHASQTGEIYLRVRDFDSV